MIGRSPLVTTAVSILVIAALAVFFVPSINAGSSDSPVEPVDIITIAYASDVQPFHFTDSEGNPAGIMVDIWNLWSEKTGIHIAFMEASWDESLKIVGSGEADVHAGLFFSEERDEFLDYGTSFVDTETHVFRHKSLPPINDINELAAYRVGVLKGDYVESYLGDSLTEENLVSYPSYNEMFEALKEGSLKVFAADTPTGLYILKQNGLLSDFLYESEKPLYREKWYAAAGEGRDGLLEKMNEGFALISEEEKLAIERKWTGAEGTDGDGLIIGIGRSFEPLAFINSLGQPSGLLVDMWREWSRITGRPIEFRGSSWTETLEGLKSGSIDIHSGLSLTDERSEFFGFSNPIYRTHSRIYHRPDEEQPENIEGYRDFVVGIQYGTYMDGEFRKSYPQIPIKNYSTGQDLIKALLEGEVKAAVHEAHLMEGQLDRLGLAGSTEARSEILFPSPIYGGVRKGNSLLLRQINEGFESISAERLAELEKRWIFDPAKRFFGGASDGHVSGGFSLTEEERAFLEEHPVITLGGPDVPPLDFIDEKGRPAGIGPDYMELVAGLLGIRFEYVTEAWSKVHEMAREKEIDGIRILVKSEERKEYLNFTVPYTPFEYAIIIPNDASPVRSLEDLSGRSLAVLDASVDQSYVKEKYPGIKLIAYGTYEEGLRAVFNGEADAFLGALASASYQIQEKMLFGLKVAATVEELSSDLYMGIRKDWPQFIPILNKALNSITGDQHREIKSKWFSLTQDRDKETILSLTSEERDFLISNPLIRVHNEMDWPPYNYNEGGIAKGFSIDYFNLAAEKAGLEVEYLSGPSWDEFMTMAENREIDVMLNIARNDSREKFLDFTSPYLTVSRRIVHRENNGPYNKFSDLNGRKTALVEGFFTTSYLKQNFPEIEQVLFRSTSDALLAVARGEAEAYIGEYGVTLYLIDKNRLSDLVISPPLAREDFPINDLHFGVRKDWPVLTGILNKALAEISLQERSQLQDKWFPREDHQQEESRESSLINIVIQISIIVLALLVMLFGIYFMTRQILGKSDDKGDVFSSGKMRSFGLVLLFILVTVILAMSYFGLARIRNKNTFEFRKYMISILENTENSLNLWIDHNLTQLELFARDPELKRMVEKQLAENRTTENLLQSDGLRELRDFFRDKRVEFENEGFFIISPDRINIASKRNGNLGLINLIEEQRPELLAHVFEGRSRFIPPVRSDVLISESDGELPPTMFYAVPIFGDDGEVIAALTLRDIPMNEFSSFCEQSRLGDSGETYAFDENGTLLSESRFNNDLIEMGLIEDWQRSLLNVIIAEPDGDRPFTEMMLQAAQKVSGENFDGYRDYRGEEVFGAWKWNERHGFGLATEIDVDEALANFNTVRSILIVILLITLLLAMGATSLSIIIGQRANSALAGARDELEDRVQSRTAQLKKSEERSQSLLEAAPDGMVIVDEKHVIIQVNNQTEIMFGYSREELIGREIEILVPELRREAHIPRREAYIKDPTARAMGAIMEILAQRKDGTTFPADIGLSPIHTDEGLLIVSSVRDITERKKNEQSIQENEQKFKALFEKSTTAIVIFDDEGILECNDAAVQMMGAKSREDMLSRHPAEFSPEFQPDGRLSSEKSIEMDGLAIEKGFHRFDWTHKRIDTGELYPVEVSLSRILLNGEEVILTLWHDLTERKKYEEELKKLSTAVEQSPLSLVITDTGGNIEYVNPRFSQVTGYSEEEVLGQNPRILNAGVQPVEHYVRLWDTIRSGEVWDGEFCNRNKKGELYWESASIAPIKDERGEISHFVAIKEDITDQKKAREDLKEANLKLEEMNANLENIVVERTNEIKKSEKRYRSLISASNTGAWEFDSKTNNLWCSEEYFSMLGRDAAEYDLISSDNLDETWVNLLHPDDRENASSLFGEYLKNGSVGVYENYFRMLHKDGSWLWIWSRGSTIRDEEGNVTSVTVGTHIDITEKKKSELELEKHRNNLEELIEERTKELALMNQLVHNSLNAANIGAWWVDFNEEDTFHALDTTAELIAMPVSDDKTYKISEWGEILVKTGELDPEYKKMIDYTFEQFTGAVSGKYEMYRATYPVLQTDGSVKWIVVRADVPERKEDGSALLMTGTLIDITDLKKAEDNVKRSEARLKLSTESAGIAVWEWYVTEDKIEGSPLYYDLFGFEPEQEKIAETWASRLHPDDKDETLKALSDHMEGKTDSYYSEFRYLHPKTNEYVWLSGAGKVVETNDDGTPKILMGINENINERRQMELDIKQINFMSDNALDLTRAGFWKIDYSNPEYYYSSPRAADIFGESHNDDFIYHLTDEWLARIIEADPAVAKATGKNYSDAVEGLIPRYDAIYPYKRPKDGKIVWIRAIGDVIRDDKGQALFMYGVAQDITEVHDAEIEIRMQHDQLLKIIEELPIPTAHWKLDGTILHLNKVLTELLGYTIDDVPTVDSHFEKFYPDPEERKEYKKVWRQFLEEAAQSGTAVKPLMLNATAKTGEVKNLLTHTIQIGDRALTLWVDFTEREKYEKALENAKIVAEEATKAKSDFLANMSHEIRTPMNAIIGLSHLIQKTELSRKQDDYIQKISGSAHNLLGIINDILDFSKIEAGKLTMESIDFNLNEVFDNLGSMMGNKTRDKGLELIFDIATDIPPNLVGDPLRLGQILLNLTNNAVKFTEKGEIVVSVELEEKDPREAMLKFKVRDTGIGLTDEQAGNLFQAFSQADTSTTRKFGGTGLGLSISKKLSEMMGGKIGVESVFGEGSTFYFSGVFQYRKAKKREVLPEEIRNLNVLIVDDNATSREVLTAYARDFSFSSVAVANGQEAIRLIRETKEERKDPFDLVLMDYMMPGLNGYETANKINEILIEGERPRYILVTSYGRDEILDAVDDAGFSGFILKPINQSIMFNTIVEAFGLASDEDKRKTGEKFPDGFDLVRGASILLAEDNEINQQVAREVLESEGFYVDIANNGREAVAMNRAKDYDIILMDLQMPVLDGYGATEEIRGDKAYKDLSIVAMTADAMTGVRDNVIEIGMNDYITKPIDTSQLWRALAKWIKPGEREMPEGFGSRNQEPGEDMELFPVQGIDVVGGLNRVGGNKKLYIGLLDKFVSDFVDFEVKIVDLIREGKADEAVRLAHTLKGVGSNLGAEPLADKSALLEVAIKDNIDVDNRLQAVCTLLQAVIENIGKSGNLDRETGKTPSEKTLSQDEIRQKLLAAADSLKKRKPKPALEILDMLEETKLPDETGDMLKECRTLLSRYKMKEALSIMEDMIGGTNA